MSTGILIEGCKDIRILNCHISGFDIAVDAINSENLSVMETSFSQVRTGVRARNVRGLKAHNNTESHVPSFRLKPTVILVLSYIEFLKNKGI